MSKIAIVQQAPVFLNKTKTIIRTVDSVQEAAAGGAELVIFTEAYIAGYPAWIWRLRPGSDWSLCEEIHALLLDNAVDLASTDLAPLCDAARQHSVTIVCGMNETDSSLSRATLYNTVVVIDPDGRIINRHRKLMPTNPERMVWGFGDASELKGVELKGVRALYFLSLNPCYTVRYFTIPMVPDIGKRNDDILTMRNVFLTLIFITFHKSSGDK